MKSGHDINTISGDGYLVVPLSMSRLHEGAGQSPKEAYAVPDYFAQKMAQYSSDVIFLYTNGLYFNSEDISFEKRKKTNSQVVQHNRELQNIIRKDKKYIPGAFHFLPIDYIILNAPEFSDFFASLKRLEETDGDFRTLLKKDMGDRECSEAQVNFMLEEIAVSHILREKLVQLPRTLVKEDSWRLIVYPGMYISADVYQWQKKVLPQTKAANTFKDAWYNFAEKKIYYFDEINLEV